MSRVLYPITILLALHALVLTSGRRLEEPANTRTSETLTDAQRDALMEEIRRTEHPRKPVLVERRGKLFKKTYKPWKKWSKDKYIWRWDKDFPIYNQHKCCGCSSGCGPVGWAMVFAYYARLARRSSAYGYRKALFRCKNGVSGGTNCKVPLRMNKKVRRYVEAIRKEVKTWCKNGVGLTNAKGMEKIQKWYRARQGSKASISGYWKARSYRKGIPQGWIRDCGSKAIRQKYPVLFSFWTDKGTRHIAAALKYKRRTRKWRWCIWRLFAGKWGCFGKWRTQEQERFWMIMGWGESKKNGWWNIKPYAAFVARRG